MSVAGRLQLTDLNVPVVNFSAFRLKDNPSGINAGVFALVNNNTVYFKCEFSVVGNYLHTVPTSMREFVVLASHYMGIVVRFGADAEFKR